MTTAIDTQIVVELDDEVAHSVQVALCYDLANEGEVLSRMTEVDTPGGIFRFCQKAERIGGLGHLIDQLHRRDYKGPGRIAADQATMYGLAERLWKRADDHYDPDDGRMPSDCCIAARAIARALSGAGGDA
ncbi:MAG: hypothetical protein QOI89_2493 [Solirubrobacteraceae bacterium]|jgi:hypothetical protein|nr:hypothetical protein [Solirubrobacteraceae bacterium]